MAISLPFGRRELDRTLRYYNRDELIALFRSAFPKIFSSGVGVWEGYTLEEHVRFVLTQFDRYFARSSFPEPVNAGTFRVFLVLHDIGKPEAVIRGNKKLQHFYTLQMLPEIMRRLSFSDKEIKIFSALVSSDALGAYIKGRRSLNQTSEEIGKLAGEAEIKPRGFFKLLRIYYMCDAGSYTQDAGGLKSLDFIFKFNRKDGTMDFSQRYKNRIKLLEGLLERE